MSSDWTPPTIPISCGAIVRDEQGRLLVLKPTYKKGWTIPGGIMEADGETPWEGCQREVREGTGLEVTSGRLVVVDTKRATRDEQLAVRFLFDCGTIGDDAKEQVVLQIEEIAEHRWAPVDEAMGLLRKRIRRRVAAGLEAEGCVYLEDGRPADGVS